MPIAAIFAIVYAPAARNRGALVSIGVLVLCAICLWLGWRWMKGTLIAKWIGFCFAAWVAVRLVLFPFTISVALLPFLLLLIPIALYDLFILQPWKGRFARARAERRGIPG